MRKPFGGIVLDTAFRVLVPFTLVYGIYVLTHGEYSPGGGFQAGALLAVGMVLARLIEGKDTSFTISGDKAVIIAGVGTSIYALTGLTGMLMGGQFLDYGMLPFGLHELNELHALGILIIEIGVTMCVMATIIDILDAIVEGEVDND